ncbi:MAG: putative baseplate assembly protein [Anaerolineae bacterium]|nr:putative baseplate assembly protein [Anaerolineae bacterium]
MPLPAPNLDDLRFQRDLVDEARRRIIRYCPEWTDYNLSDPGITLIELFAFLSEMLLYRVNQVPERNRLKFLEMLGVCLQPASSARAELTFYLSVPLPITPEDSTTVAVPQGMEVATRPTEEEAEVTFTTDERLTIAPPRLVQLRRGGSRADLTRNYLSRLGIEVFYPFTRPKPQMGDTFYLGFDEAHDISGYLLRLTFECEETQAVGVRREDPPLVWECSLGDDQWEEVRLSTRLGEKDTTGGLNNPYGSLVLYLPLSMKPDQVHGRNAYWLRCRLEQRRAEQGMYTESPRIREIAAYALGGTVWATHAVFVRDELLGYSNGEPGQVFHLHHAPTLALREGETVQVEEKREGELVFIPWQRVHDLSSSTRYDRHFTLDESTGEVRFGPAVRQPDGSVCQYGRVPEAGRRIRLGLYRHGGGVTGNVPAGKIQVIKSAIPYVDRVINLGRAEGGRDQESLEEAKMRAARELRAQQRAVTAEDFEDLGKGASRAVARVKCNTAALEKQRSRAKRTSARALSPGTVELLVVPAAFEALQAGDLSKLYLEEDLKEQIRSHLDGYRLLTTTLHIREPSYFGIKVYTEIVVTEYSQPDVVKARVEESLKCLISPLPLCHTVEVATAPQALDQFLGPEWEGWPFGRDLYVSEIYSLIQKVPGVKHVLDVRLSYRPVVPSKERPPIPRSAEGSGGPSGSARDAEEWVEKGSSPVGAASRRRSPSGDGRPTLEAGGEGSPTEEILTKVDQRVIPIPADGLCCSLDHDIRIVEL